jgi:hypothetical protein
MYLITLKDIILPFLYKKNAEHIITSSIFLMSFFYKLKANDNVILELFVFKVAASVRPTEYN